MLTNHQKTILLNIIANPLFIALPITILIVLFLPNPSSKYKIELVSKKIADKQKSKIVFYDLNNDGIDERVIEFHNAVKGEASIKILANEGLIYDTWNFHGFFQNSSENFYCSDFDEDGYAELFVFYYRNDSVFLTAIQPYPEKKLIVEEKLITTVQKRNEKIDYIISDFKTFDLNGDRFNELIFLLKAGYSRQPRVIVSYDIYNDSITKSKSIGAKSSHLNILDINGDSIPELYLGSYTAANIPDSLLIPYSDYNSYFFAYDNNLEFIIPPIVNPIYPSSVQVCKFQKEKGEQLIAVSFNNTVENTQILRFYDSDYKLFFQKKLNNPGTEKSNIVSYMKNVNIKGKNLLLFGISNNKFILFDEKGGEFKKKLFEDGTSFRIYEDLNKDGKKEFVFFNAKNDLFVYDYNLENPIKFENNETPFSTLWGSIGVKHNGDAQDEIYLKTDIYLYLYIYKPDYYYYMKYPLWLLVYAIVAVILWFTQRMQRIQTLRKQRLEETINSLQLKTIKSQMDPHFMFNVLNGLANNVAKGSSDETYNQILRFSKLLRSMMSRSERIDISLREEFDFVKNYLELEKFRFKDDFEYSIEIGENVDANIRIPRMLIQLLVENSIKHGLRNKIGLKSILIRAYFERGETKIIVEDNGVGRQKAQEKTSTTGMGLKIISDMISLNKKLTGKEITLNYSDLDDENGVAQGTSVEVII